MVTQFKVSIGDIPNQSITLAAFAYDRRNNQVGFSIIEKGQFSLETNKISAKLIRVFIAPISDASEKALAFSVLQKRNAFEVKLPIRLSKVVDLGRIPDDILSNWILCLCVIKGRILNSHCENPNIPVVGARVHICEVDTILHLINIAPDWQIINLRDWILRYVNLDKYIKVPPIINWPPIGPDPSPIEDIIRGKTRVNPIENNKRAYVFNPMVQQQPDVIKNVLSQNSKIIQEVVFSGNSELTFGEENIPLSKVFPLDNAKMFFSANAVDVRKYLVDFHPIIFPNICKIISWFYRYDEIGIDISDRNGNFSYSYFHNCKDKPDIYIWVEYPSGGGWSTIYRPYVGCSTLWNYRCGTDITIHINNPLVPCANEVDVNVGPKSVVVLSMGEWANVAHIEQGPINTGIPKAGVFKGGPFGSTIDPRVYFHKSLALDVDNPGGLNYFYRWSYRRMGAEDWLIMDAPVTRHYEDFIPPSPVPVFPTYQVGPNAEMLYRILKFKTPDDKDIFTKYASDLADAYFETNQLVGHPSLSDGIYEVKMELYKYIGAVATRINWTAEGINLYIPTDDIVSFQNTTITVETNPIKLAPYQYRLKNIAGNMVEDQTGDLFGFKMKMFVDNNAPIINIDDFYVDTPGNEPDCCGFVNYGLVNPHIHFDFTAKQKNDFADFQVSIAGYQGVDTVDSDTFIPSGAGSLQMTKASVPAETFTGNILGNYTGDIPVSGALAGCPPPGCTKKVIGIGLNIDWYAHNGTHRLWSTRDTRSTAFAIEG